MYFYEMLISYPESLYKCNHIRKNVILVPLKFGENVMRLGLII